MPLVYPRSKPLGVNSRMSQEAISDDASFPTKVIDYLKFDIFDHKTGAGIDNGTIYLYLPQALSEGYGVTYNTVRLGAVGAAGINAARNFGPEGPGEGFGEQMKAAAQAGKSGIVFKAGSSLINTAIGMSGMGDGNLTANDLAALSTGQVFNPYEEAVFKGQDKFRDHKFTFKLVPKNASDVREIYEIINVLRNAMLPGKGPEHWLSIPEFFRISIVRHVDSGVSETVSNPGTGSKMGVLNKLMQFPTKLVLTNMSLNFSPEGGYSSLQTQNPGGDDLDYGPAAYQMDLSFQETAFITKESFK